MRVLGLSCLLGKDATPQGGQPSLLFWGPTVSMRGWATFMAPSVLNRPQGLACVPSLPHHHWQGHTYR